jgi:hypothetical protein
MTTSINQHKLLQTNTNIQMPYFLFFDLETTGLLRGKPWELSYSKPEQFPNIVQISWELWYYPSNTTGYQLRNKSPKCILEQDFIVKPEGYTIPGERWLENCIKTMETNEGLLGTVGLLYPNPLPSQHSSYYEHYLRFGWPPSGNNDKTIQVDLVGHSWFFKKEWLQYLVRELPDPKYNTCGEDMHFSYMLQKYAGIPTFVPPHPKNDKSLWGSTKGEYGGDANSLWESNQRGIDGTPFKELMNEYFHNQRKKGWKLVNEK